MLVVASPNFPVRSSFLRAGCSRKEKRCICTSCSLYYKIGLCRKIPTPHQSTSCLLGNTSRTTRSMLTTPHNSIRKQPRLGLAYSSFCSHNSQIFVGILPWTKFSTVCKSTLKNRNVEFWLSGFMSSIELAILSHVNVSDTCVIIESAKTHAEKRDRPTGGQEIHKPCRQPTCYDVKGTNMDQLNHHDWGPLITTDLRAMVLFVRDGDILWFVPLLCASGDAAFSKEIVSLLCTKPGLTLPEKCSTMHGKGEVTTQDNTTCCCHRLFLAMSGLQAA